MKDFIGKVAVVTGAASGIGYAVAERCVREGMKVVLADIEEPALTESARKLGAAGGTVVAVRTDVARVTDIEALARRTLEAFGAVHLLCNNAGVGAGGAAWESTLADWEWVLGVNLWGVIHGVRTFVPIMLGQNTEGHIVNTASVAGLLAYHPSASYQVTKHAVVALSEQLYQSLLQRNAPIGVSVLCPGWVKTRIMESERNRPAALQNPPSSVRVDPLMEAVLSAFRQAVETGMAPERVADHVFDAIRANRFYIVTHPELNPMVRQRLEDIVAQRNPQNSVDSGGGSS